MSHSSELNDTASDESNFTQSVAKSFAIGSPEYWRTCEQSFSVIPQSVRSMTLDEIYSQAQSARENGEPSNTLRSAFYAAFVLSQVGAVIDLQGRKI